MSTIDEDAQQDEMVAMESIFDQEAFQVHPGNIRSGQIKIKLDLPDPFFIATETEVHANLELHDDGPTGNEVRYKVQFLPPLILHFTLPKNYPSRTKPNFTLSAHWLHRASLTSLCQKLDGLWEENKGMGVLFTWANYLQVNTLIDVGITDFYDVAWLRRPRNLSRRISHTLEKKLENSVESYDQEEKETTATHQSQATGPALDVPGCSEEIHLEKLDKKRKCKSVKKTAIDNRAVSDTIPRKEGKDVSLLDYMLLYNEEQIKETFLHATHSCDICFTIKTGHSCVRFRCGHVFCEECVTGFFTTNITEGNVDQIKCLAFNCKMHPTPVLIQQLVGEALYDRYDQILLKRALENMSDVTYCPRPKCYNPVICDPNEKCAFCTVCSYTFCRTCKMVYHGVEPCRFKDADMKDVFKKYTEGTVTEKNALVKAYGEKQLKILVENVLSEQWIQNESKQCPHCKVPIEKFEGCNKVTCFKCNTYFCWLCLKQLEHGNPYFHFNDPSSKCYNNLFQDADNDGPHNEWLIIDDDSSDDEINDLDIDLLG